MFTASQNSIYRLLSLNHEIVQSDLLSDGAEAQLQTFLVK